MIICSRRSVHLLSAYPSLDTPIFGLLRLCMHTCRLILLMVCFFNHTEFYVRLQQRTSLFANLAVATWPSLHHLLCRMLHYQCRRTFVGCHSYLSHQFSSWWWLRVPGTPSPIVRAISVGMHRFGVGNHRSCILLSSTLLSM